MRASKKVINFFEVQEMYIKGSIRFGGKVDNKCVSFICFTFSSIVSPQGLPCVFLLVFALGSRFLQTRGSWSSHGLPLVLLCTL